MNERVIDYYLELGYWVQVSPLANAGSGWICGVYKKGKKTGNWITESTKQEPTPHECYNWADKEIHRLLRK